MLKIPTEFPQPGFYYHYKHSPEKGVRDYAYEVIGVGFHTEDDCRPQDACFVDYRPLYEEASVYQASLQMGIPAIDHRPLDMFMETVIKDGRKIPRFQKITDPNILTRLEVVKKKMYM